MDATAHRPALRAGVTLEEGDRPALIDPVLDRRLALGGTAGLLARLVDGRRTVAELREEASGLGMPEARVDDTLRLLQALNLVEGAGAGIVARVARLKSGEDPVRNVFLEGGRFECQGSGQCCRTYRLGPLTDDDVARLDALDPEKVPFAGAPPYWEETRDPDGALMRFLKTRDERCAFLLEDQRCGIHAAVGYEAKPVMCRIYPFDHVLTIDGLKVFDRGACSRFAVSERRGLPIADHTRVMRASPAGGVVYHPIVHVGGATVADYGHWLAHDNAVIHMIGRAPGTAPAVLRAVARAARALAEAMDACPIARGEPDATVARRCARVAELDPALFASGGDRDAARRAAADALLDVLPALFEVTSMVIASRYRAGKALMGASTAAEAAELLHGLAAQARRAADPAAPLEGWYAEVAAVDFGDAESDEVLRLSLRQQLYGRAALVEDQAVPGLLRLALIQLLAVHGARMSAARDGRTRATAEDLSNGHMLAVRTLEIGQARDALLEHADAVWAIAEGLPELIGWRGA